VSGKIRVVLPFDISVADRGRIERECHKINEQGQSTRLTCKVSEEEDYFEAEVTDSAFGGQGVQPNQFFKIEVKGLRNARMTEKMNLFTF
jgi:hypothetical protein